MRLKQEDLDLLIAESGRMSVALPTDVTMRANGAALSAELRDELLAKVRAGEHVEIELDLLAYEQMPGKRNRNFVRVRDAAMNALGKSGVGNPVLRDHAQDDSLAVAGKVIASKTAQRGEGDYEIRQTWRLSAPWAVELALRGLLSTVSVSWRRTGPVMCSMCNAPIFTKCYHCPGEQFAERVGDDGVKRLVRDPAGSVVVEWIYSGAELIETSMCPIPAVPNARIDGIRAALSAINGGDVPQGKNEMNPELLALLGLAATAGDSEALSAVKSLVADRAELAIAKRDLAAANVELKILTADKAKSETDAFISAALSSGRIAKGDEPSWRDLFELSADRARKRMAERLEGSATPVGQARQSSTLIEDPAKPSGALAQSAQILAANGIDPNAAAEFATKFGVKGDPHKAIAQHCTGQEV